jgi:hypothetical protein
MASPEGNRDHAANAGSSGHQVDRLGRLHRPGAYHQAQVSLGRRAPGADCQDCLRLELWVHQVHQDRPEPRGRRALVL